jgi:hypothetical protein
LLDIGRDFAKWCNRDHHVGGVGVNELVRIDPNTDVTCPLDQITPLENGFVTVERHRFADRTFLHVGVARDRQTALGKR